MEPVSQSFQPGDAPEGGYSSEAKKKFSGIPKPYTSSHPPLPLTRKNIVRIVMPVSFGTIIAAALILTAISEGAEKQKLSTSLPLGLVGTFVALITFIWYRIMMSRAQREVLTPLLTDQKL